MIWIDLAQHCTAYLGDVASWHGMGHSLLDQVNSWHWHWSGDHLAALFDTDVFAGTRNFFNNFVKSGQAWALVVGLVLGYVIRGFMTYG
jgi:hypothetical protein